MNNLAIYLKNIDEFKKGFIYECTQPYNGMIDICSPNGDLVRKEIGDKNFTYILNPTMPVAEILKNNHTVSQYVGSIIN